ncbi:uncharacterized protein LOC121779348 isoform X1 [Salvia splendens]|uniref:uncharacterized protein LOC121779348 isoform X1 n=1 Tax=Salvia splendens TaxID=180675 RepID=UPI001C26D486|nr:uncharacterized protein LOC121779348 isoform X1 [Salvia splendens]XP_042032608.1 uncharacterized protein LOC121779348 isoform X1 [Salvia splendens]XP_042032609.1 uncharacterized protein LOC121779348 isoform X1 [Salvia splendens]
MQVLKDTPVEIRSSDYFKMMWDMMRRAFGIADTTIEQNTNPVGTLTQSMSQEECHGSQWSETLDALLKGAQELLDKRHEFPSFSLGMGFTQDLYARADVGGGNGGLGAVNEVLIHEKHKTDDVVIDAMGGWSDIDIEEHHLLVASLADYECNMEPDMTVGNNGAEVIAKGVANHTPSTMAGGVHTIPKVNKSDDISLDESWCHEKGTSVEIANAIKLTNSIVQDIARELEHDHTDSIICSEHQQALIVEKGKEKAHGPTLEVSEYQDRHQTTDKIAIEAPPISEELVRGVQKRATKRKGPALCSPYNERAVPITIKLSSEERDMYYWLVWTQGENDNMEVYFDDIVLLTKIQMLSMKPHSHVFEKVVDAWSSYLNNMEFYRAPSSPSRVFMTTFPCLHSFLNHTRDWDRTAGFHDFCQSVDSHVQNLTHFNWNVIDMVLFPMYSRRHYYLISFGLKTGKMDIIDSCPPSNGLKDRSKYGDDIELLQYFFSSYLEGKKHKMLAKIIKGCEIRIINMPWQGTGGKDDDAIFLMRHMETYMGQKVKDWHMGLANISMKNLQNMRGKYCKALLTTDFNYHSVDIKDCAKKYFKDNKEKRTKIVKFKADLMCKKPKRKLI